MRWKIKDYLFRMPVVVTRRSSRRTGRFAPFHVRTSQAPKIPKGTKPSCLRRRRSGSGMITIPPANDPGAAEPEPGPGARSFVRRGAPPCARPRTRHPGGRVDGRRDLGWVVPRHLDGNVPFMGANPGRWGARAMPLAQRR